MLKFFYKLFNNDKIDELNRTIEIYKERNDQLESEVREYKGYKLKFEVTKLYVEDDEALVELFEVARKAEQYKSNLQHDAFYAATRQTQQQGLATLAGLQGAGQAQARGIY